jgi:hypothetical protein
MLIHLYGLDSYRRKQKLNEIVAEFLKRHTDATIERFSFESDAGNDALARFIEHQSLFAVPMFAIVDNCDNAPKTAAALLKRLISDSTKTLVLLSDKKLASPLTFLYRSPVIVQSFQQLGGDDIKRFIEREAKARRVPLTPTLIGALAAAWGSDTWRIITELEQISLGGTPETHVAAPQFFGLVQRLCAGRTVRERLVAATYLLESEDAAKTFNIAAAIINPELKAQMADYDVAIKSGKLGYEEAVLDLATS